MSLTFFKQLLVDQYVSIVFAYFSGQMITVLVRSASTKKSHFNLNCFFSNSVVILTCWSQFGSSTSKS